MTFQEAHKKLKRLARGKYHALQFALTTYEDGEEKTSCGVYVDGTPWFTRNSWKEALEALKSHLNYKTQPNEEIPLFLSDTPKEASNVS